MHLYQKPLHFFLPVFKGLAIAATSRPRLTHKIRVILISNRAFIESNINWVPPLGYRGKASKAKK